ncbi:MAG: archaeoflavoprotein AfpA [Nitrososphaerota archaeon]|nr:archaeoflavoprotein AfpA [Nitrososphaerales archaeon]MDW8044908.1 archaeoflavoprotein AfpA [Nitrososphaerota archaeon]
MTIRIAWGITGSGHFLSETVNVMKEIVKEENVKVTIFLSKAAVMVVKWYKVWNDLESISPRVLIERDANSPFIAGALQTGKYDLLLIAPASANTVAKIVYGIADTLITNTVALAQKGGMNVYILPTDQESGSIITTLPSGEKLKLIMREVDVENVNKLRSMKGIVVLKRPDEIKDIVKGFTNR